MQENKNHSVSLEAMMPLFREYLAAGKTVRFAPRGTSMLPLLRQGVDDVVISPLPQRLKKYDIALYRRDNGAYVLHRILGVGDTYTCIGDNQYVYECGLRHDQMIGIVTAVYRKGVRRSVTEPFYLIYTRLWHWTRRPRSLWLRVCHKLRRPLP